MIDAENKLIVVLGMHRSGTSAITRGLQVMGVRLGDRMMPPVEGNNAKGFWEDIDLNALNIEMLSAVGSDWCHLADIDSIDIEILRKQGYFLRAVELLRQKISGSPIFGFKDPRVAKLLYFWEGVFGHCQFDVSYILAVRHPLSVVKSLAKRDGIESEQSYLLWLGHVITSLNGSADNKRILVDYDRLMQTPDRELMRVAKFTGLEIDPAELQNYKNEFLDQGLRHTVYELNDLLLDDTCPPIVREVYAALLDVASEKTKIDDLELQKKVVRWSNEFERLRSPLLLIDKLLAQKMVATQAAAERNGQIANINQAVAERDGQIASLNQAVAEQDGHIANLNQALADRERRSTDRLAALVGKLAHETSERDRQIANLNQAAAERDGQIGSLTQTVAKRDEQIAHINQAVANSDGQIASLTQMVAQRDGHISHINQAVATSEEQVANINQTVAEQDGHITNLNQALADRERRSTDRLAALVGKLAHETSERDRQIANLNQAAAERDGQIGSLTQTVAKRDEQIAHINQAVANSDEQIANLNRAVAEQDGHIAILNQALADRECKSTDSLAALIGKLAHETSERDRQIANLNQAAAERDRQIANFNQAAVERDGQIGSVNQAVAERDGQIARLNQAEAERDGQIAGLKAGHDLEIAALHRSKSWRITKPLRFVSRLLSGNRKELRFVKAIGLEQPVSLANAACQELTQDLDQLPNGFDRDVYLKLNPDVAQSGGDPTIHYLLHGRHEGRVFSLSDVCAAHDLKYDRQTNRELTQDLDNLPNDFDRDVYLKLNPDVADAGFDPTTHYLFHGRHEGRMFLLPAIDLCGDHEFKPDRATILVVSHEASRTGAPMLSLNLVQALVEPYNVVALLLGGGPLSDAFRQAGAAVITSSNLRGNPVLAHLIVGQLCARFSFKFALVNSIESCVVLPALGDHFVPTISLVHEFASYIRPRDAFRAAFFWSGEVVFSANVTMENALAEYPDLCDRSTHIFPQGRCLLPLSEFNEEELQAESERIRRLIRPKDIAENSVIVLGAGSVQYRKGVDLFIECAARVIRTPEGDRCRFVWIGKGYDPDNDAGYSVYLADQIRRAGLQGHVFFVDETTAIETAYEEADLLLLSSRLDPLPNVAIDAMAHGVPVLCFNKTTGIADFLIDSGLRNHCVAEYLDSADMAEKILALAGSQVLRENTADRCRVASIAYFSMKGYVARLEVLARGACDRTQQEKADTQVILDSGLFRRDFSCPPHRKGQSIEAEVHCYVRAWASGIDRRKPFPGFHPGIYLEQHGLVIQEADPFADYLRSGQPEGPWNYPVIVAGETMAQDLPHLQRVALHLHAYYPELLPEIITRLARNRICPDLFVSITDENARELVVNELKDYKGKVVDIQLVPNRGRDIGPFLTEFGQRLVADYDFIGHIHTKKSVDIKDASIGKSWYRFLLENLLGGESGGMADNILTRMKDDTSIGMVFPDDPYVVGWGANRSVAEPLAARIGLEKLPEHFVFSVGTMFWAKTSALIPFMSLKLDWDEYPEEPLPYDGTSLHAIERLFSLSLSVNNFRGATTNVIGLTR